jgi:hypothetical protein
VSAEELKHEMSAEKGLAWFDLGNGRIVKGRSFWFNASIPETWEGREFIVRPERFEVDEIGLADWVDEQILSQEQDETSSKFAPKAKAAAPEPLSAPSHRRRDDPELPSEPPGAFKLSLNAKGMGRPRGAVTAVTKSPVSPPADPPQSKAPQAASGGKGGGGKDKGSKSGEKSAPKTGPLRFRK